MSTINSETGEVVQGRSPRFTMWVVFLIFATISLGSSVEVKNGSNDPNKASKWAIACSSVTFAVTLLVTIAHVLPIASTLIVGTKLEGIISLIMAAFWAATVAIVTNASNGLGVESQTNTVLNGNLYYASWGGFITSIVLLVNYLKEIFGVDVVGKVRNRSARLSLWAGLLASAFIVLGSSVRVFNGDCDGSSASSQEYCKRTKFAIANGTILCFFSIAIVGMKLMTSSAPFVVEFVTSIFLAVLSAFGVAYVTSAKGPGSQIGNLYYASWICFMSSAFLAAETFNEYSSAGAAGGSSNHNMSNGDDKHDGDIQVEELGDERI